MNATKRADNANKQQCVAEEEQQEQAANYISTNFVTFWHSLATACKNSVIQHFMHKLLETHQLSIDSSAIQNPRSASSL